MYAQDVDKMELPGLLMELSKLYFENLGKEDEITSSKEPEHKPEKEVYQCAECLTVYDTDFGDKQANIAPGTTFAELPLDYTCSVCEASKNTYKLVTI
jgi:rubredoxin